MDLHNDVASVATAREFVRSNCAAAGLSPGVCHTAALLASETVTNSFVHAGSDVALTVSAGPRGVRVEVLDDDPRHPLPGRLDDFEALGGRGIAIVSELAAHWGSRPSGTGKSVWFVLHED